MKKITLKTISISAAFLLALSLLNAQVTLTKNLPPIGTAYQRHYVVKTDINGIASPQSGIDVTWDYSTLTLAPMSFSPQVYPMTDLSTSIQNSCPNGQYTEVSVMQGAPNFSANPLAVYGVENDYLIRYIDKGSSDSYTTIRDTVFCFNQAFNTVKNLHQYGPAMSGNSIKYPYKYAGSGTLKIGSETIPNVVMFENTTNSASFSIFNFYTLSPFFHNIAYVQKQQGSGSALFYNKLNLSTASIDDYTKNEFEISVYPNPAKNIITLTNISNGSVIKVLDITGKEVIKSLAVNTNKQTTIDTGELSNGIYLIRIDDKGIITNKKLIINK